MRLFYVEIKCRLREENVDEYTLLTFKEATEIFLPADHVIEDK